MYRRKSVTKRSIFMVLNCFVDTPGKPPVWRRMNRTWTMQQDVEVSVDIYRIPEGESESE